MWFLSLFKLWLLSLHVDSRWKQWSGCGLQHRIGPLTTSVICSLHKESYKNTWCNTRFCSSQWSSALPLSMLPTPLGQTPRNPGCGMWPCCWSQDWRQSFPSLVSTKATRCSRSKQSRDEGAVTEGTDVTVALRLSVKHLRPPGSALISEAAPNPLSCSRASWKQNLPPLSQLTFNKSLQEKVDIKSKALL